MAVVAPKRRTFDDEAHRAAEAAAARGAARSGIARLEIGEGFEADARREGVETRQRIGDLVPRRLGSEEDVRERLRLRIALEHSSLDRHALVPDLAARHLRAAARAERPKDSRRRLEANDPLVASQQTKRLGAAHEIARERRPARLPAADAVAVREEIEVSTLPGDVAAETSGG